MSIVCDQIVQDDLFPSWSFRPSNGKPIAIIIGPFHCALDFHYLRLQVICIFSYKSSVRIVFRPHTYFFCLLCCFSCYYRVFLPLTLIIYYEMVGCKNKFSYSNLNPTPTNFQMHFVHIFSIKVE